MRDGFKRKLESFGTLQEQILSWVLLQVIDEKWRDHLYDLDHLKASIGFRSYGQKDPLIEYKQEAYSMFVDLMSDIYNTFSDRFLKVQLQFGPPPDPGSFPPNGADPADRRNALTLETVNALYRLLIEDPDELLLLGSTTRGIFSAGADLESTLPAFIAAACVPLLEPWAKRWGLVDHPQGRKESWNVYNNTTKKTEEVAAIRATAAPAGSDEAALR